MKKKNGLRGIGRRDNFFDQRVGGNSSDRFGIGKRKKFTCLLYILQGQNLIWLRLGLQS